MTTLQFKGKYVLSGHIHCITGLHVGGTTTGVEIGGVDNPVIKDPLTDQPVIPGSSLKGKLRAMTEWQLGLIAPHPKHHTYGAYDCNELKSAQPPAQNPQRWQAAFAVGRLFGVASDDNAVRMVAGPSRLTVRDAKLTSESSEALQERLGDGIFTEVKTENALDRVTAEANPRPIERVPAGAKFEFRFIVDMFEDVPAGRDDRELLQTLFAAMRLVEQSSLGGAGSRGSGEVQFVNLQLEWRNLNYYRSGANPIQINLPSALAELHSLDFAALPIG